MAEINDASRPFANNNDQVNANANANNLPAAKSKSKTDLKPVTPAPPLKSGKVAPNYEEEDESEDETEDSEDDSVEDYYDPPYYDQSRPCTFNPCCCIACCCSLTRICVSIAIIEFLLSIPFFFLSWIIDSVVVFVSEKSADVGALMDKMDNLKEEFGKKAKDLEEKAGGLPGGNEMGDILSKYAGKEINDTKSALGLGNEKGRGMSIPILVCPEYTVGIGKTVSRIIGCPETKLVENEFILYKSLVLAAGIMTFVAAIILITSIIWKCYSTRMGPPIGCWLSFALQVLHLILMLASFVTLIQLVALLFDKIKEKLEQDYIKTLAKSALFTVDVADILAYRKTIDYVIIACFIIHMVILSYFALCTFAIGLEFRADSIEQEQETQDYGESDDDD